MAQHSSLRVSSVGVKHRNVLKRFERIKRLQEAQKWQDRSSALGLPKIKSIKIKVKKAKSEKAASDKPAEGQAAQAPAAANAPAAKSAAPKSAAPKK